MNLLLDFNDKYNSLSQDLLFKKIFKKLLLNMSKFMTLVGTEVHIFANLL